MGAIQKGAEQGKKAGQRQGKKAGSNANAEENRVKEDAKAAGKGAVGGAAEGAARGAVSGAADGAKKGVETGAKAGAKLGAAIPYVGVVTGPLGGVIGGAVGGAAGGAGGAALGGVSGGLTGAGSGAKTGAEEAEKEQARQRKSNYRKKIGNIWDNIKGAIKGNAKDIFILKFKMAIFVVVAIMVLFALIVEGDAEDTSSDAAEATVAAFANSTSEAAELFKETGSLILATNEELETAKTNFFEEIKDSKEGYYDAFSTKYHGRDGLTVANRVKHITTNFDSGEEAEVEKITNTVTRVSGEAKLSDDKTIYEHILRTEKYNFNNIIWRSYVKSGSGLSEVNVALQVDSETKLKYPSNDSADTENDTHNLEFFVSKVRPYLQTWQIPFDIMIGTQDAQSTGALNTDLAFETMASAYHEIVMDRYKIERLNRLTNYRVYDKTTTTETTVRSCNLYNVQNPRAGQACTKDDFYAGLCKDYKHMYEVYVNQYTTQWVECSDLFFSNGSAGCTYGVVKDTVEKALCTDTKTTTVTEEKDIREAINNGNTDVKSYRWNYVISLAKLFDRVISSEYEFTPYYEYSLANYNKFINKTGSYANMTVEEYKDSEETNSKADTFEHQKEDYYNKSKEVVTDSTDWNQAFWVAAPPEGAVLIPNTETAQIILQENTIEKKGFEYKDTYDWNDRFIFKESKSGIYNIESVKDVTGDDLSSSDVTYYKNIYLDQELNLVDLMNSDKNVYSKYLEASEISSSTTNIGIRKSKLDISYNVLEKDLRELSDTFPISGLMYGSSLGIESVGFSMLSGLNLSGIVAAGDINTTIVNYASQFVGKDLAFMLSIDDTGSFFQNHWCAMFASYVIRKIEKETGTKIPIPSFAGCSTFWKTYKNKPGFYDVIDSVSTSKNTDPNHLVSIDGIQPGDIVLFSWGDSYPRNHTAIVKEVERNASGKVTNVITIDGNWNGTGANSYNNSKVVVCDHRVGSGSIYSSLSSVASYISISTVLAEAEKGNTW